MLRSEFNFALTSWPARLLAFLLGEAFLGFLSIVAVGLMLFPMLFAMPPRPQAAIDAAQWAIIVWFAVEYLFALGSSHRRAAFLANPWRLVDLATVVIPLATLLPSVSRALLSSPVLRLVRLTRLLTLGVRVTGVAARHRPQHVIDAKTPAPAQITLVADAPEFAPVPARWEDLVRWLRSPGREWFHVANASREQLAELGAAAGLPAAFLETHLSGTNYPHLASTRKYAALFLWLPEIKENAAVERHGVLFVFSENSILSLARGPTQSIERITGPAPAAEEEAEKTPFSLRMLNLVLERVIAQNERLVGVFEQELRNLEDVPIRESRPAFFERTFRLKKELSAAQSDLWRLKGVIADIAAGRGIAGVGETNADLFRRLGANAEYLYESVVNVRDEVLSVIELHLNVVSFDMNRVMRVLAVVSVLGLIPAVIGGLFGMNLMDNPWPFTLPQVAFAIGFGMTLCLYFFFVKGWLR